MYHYRSGHEFKPSELQKTRLFSLRGNAEESVWCAFCRQRKRNCQLSPTGFSSTSSSTLDVTLTRTVVGCHAMWSNLVWRSPQYSPPRLVLPVAMRDDDLPL